MTLTRNHIKYLSILAGIFLSLPFVSSAAIARDVAHGRIVQSSATSITVSHTVSGSNRILFAGFTIDFADVATGCTYNGAAMTQINKVQSSASGRWNYLYYILAPATGTHDIVCSASTAVLWLFFSASYTGVNQSLTYTGGSPTDNSNTNSATTGTSITGTVTTLADNSWTIMSGSNGCCQANNGTGMNLWEPDDNTGAQFMGDSNGVITPAGSNSMTVTWASSNYSGVIIASFSPAATPVTTTAVADSNDSWWTFLMMFLHR